MKNKGVNILIISGNLEDYAIIRDCFKRQPYSLSFVPTENEALENLKSLQYKLILLDMSSPELNGYDLCRTIHAIPEYHDTPILFLAALMDKRSIMKGFKAGAVDYILQPYNQGEMLVRVRTHLELKNYRDKLEEINIDLNKEVLKGIRMEDELRSSKEELERVNRQLYEKATRDMLTGLFNRRKMIDFIEYEIERSSRSSDIFSLILTDIDHFKKINDTCGHDCGDTVLKDIARSFLSVIRKLDQVARWGGEEFMFLLPETDIGGAFTLAEKIRRLIEETTFSCTGTGLPSITMTFGVAEYAAGGDVEKLIKQADLALYQGKNNGRNQTVKYG